MKVSCSICKGEGYISEGNQRKECQCLLMERVKKYLTEDYQNAKYVNKMTISGLVDHNILIQNLHVQSFKSIFKSYILNTGMKYSHLSCSAYTVMQAYLQITDRYKYDDLMQCDLLCLYLIVDPPNRAYTQILTSLIEARLYSKKYTWIYSQHPVSDLRFIKLYGQEFKNYLEGNFKLVDTTVPKSNVVNQSEHKAISLG